MIDGWTEFDMAIEERKRHEAELQRQHNAPSVMVEAPLRKAAATLLLAIAVRLAPATVEHEPGIPALASGSRS
jgi:hypothetical protein